MKLLAYFFHLFFCSYFREYGQPLKAADYFIARTDSIPDHIPYWDFQDPDIPNALRDASAAAVAMGVREFLEGSGATGVQGEGV